MPNSSAKALEFDRGAGAEDLAGAIFGVHGDVWICCLRQDGRFEAVAGEGAERLEPVETPGRGQTFGACKGLAFGMPEDVNLCARPYSPQPFARASKAPEPSALRKRPLVNSTALSALQHFSYHFAEVLKC